MRFTKIIFNILKAKTFPELNDALSHENKTTNKQTKTPECNVLPQAGGNIVVAFSNH